MKKCTLCKKNKPLDEFNKEKRKKDGLSSYCKPCSREIGYNITLSEYDAMFDAQGGVCRICGQPETRKHHKSGTVFRLSVDHSHNDSRRIRSLLCGKCNTALGLLDEDLDRIEAMLDYVNSFDKPREDA